MVFLHDKHRTGSPFQATHFRSGSFIIFFVIIHKEIPAILSKLLQKTEKRKTSSNTPGNKIASHSLKPIYIFMHATLSFILSEKKPCDWEICLGIILYWENSAYREHPSLFRFSLPYCYWTNSTLQLFLPCNCVRDSANIFVLEWISCSCQILHGYLKANLFVCIFSRLTYK